MCFDIKKSEFFFFLGVCENLNLCERKCGVQREKGLCWTFYPNTPLVIVVQPWKVPEKKTATNLCILTVIWKEWKHDLCIGDSLWLHFPHERDNWCFGGSQGFVCRGWKIKFGEALNHHSFLLLVHTSEPISIVSWIIHGIFDIGSLCWTLELYSEVSSKHFMT